MAPMITDSYLKYNSSEFGSSSQTFGGGGGKATASGNGGGGGVNSLTSSLNGLGKYYSPASNYHSSSSTTNSTNNPGGTGKLANNLFTSGQYNPSMASSPGKSKPLGVGGGESGGSFSLNYLEQGRRFESDELVIDILRGNNYKQQIEVFEDLTSRAHANIEFLITFRTIDELHNALGLLLINTLSNDVQRACLRFLQIYFRSIDKLKSRLTAKDLKLNSKLLEIDANICEILIPCLITSSVSPKLHLKQISIDLIYSFMKLTHDVGKLFGTFVKYGVENTDYMVAKTFMDPTLVILVTDEFQYQDYSPLVRSLAKQLTNGAFETSAVKCLNKIEQVVGADKFNGYLNKLPGNLKNLYLSSRNATRNEQSTNVPSSTRASFDDTNGAGGSGGSGQLKFNLIPSSILQRLSGEDELQRRDAIKQLEEKLAALDDVNTMNPHHQDFLNFMTKFVDDPNYEIRVGSLKIVYMFVGKLNAIHINQCYKAVCNCARQVMSQTHQSKTIKQYLNSTLLFTIDKMKNAIVVLECLLDKIKDRNAKAREECLNVIIAALLKFPGDKFDPLKKIFFQVAPLLCDIKRNVRHAALECIAVLFSRLRPTDRNVNLLNQLEQIPSFHNSDNLNAIKEVINYRLGRNKLPVLNADMTIEYGVKIPPSNAPSLVNSFGSHEPDVEWIVSASSSSSSSTSSASNMSSARSQKSSVFSEISNQTNNLHRMINLNDNSISSISTGSFRQRRPSGTKRLPWEEAANLSDLGGQSNSAKGGGGRQRDAAPLKAFPLSDDLDFLGGAGAGAGSYASNKRAGYPSSTSYQEKYLKKLQSDNQGKQLFQSKTDSNPDLTDLPDTVRKIQNEKAYSLDNLYNLDDNINSESNIQKRKYANLNLKNGVIPSKPMIPRRNSANRYNEDDQFLKNLNNDSFETEFKNYFVAASNEYNNPIHKKYDTMPNMRNTSAKNNKTTNDMNTSRYTPSNTESGIYSMSDYTDAASEGLNRYLQSTNAPNAVANANSKKANNNPARTNTSNADTLTRSNSYSAPISMDLRAQLKRLRTKLLSTSSVPTKLDNHSSSNNTTSTSSNPPHSNASNGGDKTISGGGGGASFKSTHSSDVEIVGVKLGNAATSQAEAQSNGGGGGIQAKKKVVIKNENATMAQFIDTDNDMLDIVGKGYNHSASDYGGFDQQQDVRGARYNPDNYQDSYVPSSSEEMNFPLSLSFRSRLRQKTQEKIEEKQKRRVERIKKAKLQKELESLNSSANTTTATSPSPGEFASNPAAATSAPIKNFGLSISGYQANQPAPVNGKPPIYGSKQAVALQHQQQQHRDDLDVIFGLDDLDDKNELLFDDAKYDSYMGNTNSILPSLEGGSGGAKPKVKLTQATQARIKARAAAAEAAANKKEEKENQEEKADAANELGVGLYGSGGAVKEDFLRQPFKNPDGALKEAMSLLAQDDWEKKCHAMNIVRRLSVYHEDVAVSNIHAIVLALIPEVKNLRSQVSRFALLTFGDLFSNLKRYMDVDLDMAVKTILAKNSETNDFMRADVEKCLDKMVNNVTTHKGLIALINGGATHKNNAIRRTTAQYMYRCCEIMGPGKILSGIKDVTEKVLFTASQFVVDGPPDIRWYGRKIFHMLMSHDEFDRLLVRYLAESNRKNIKEILDTIRVKGPGDVPTESARNARKAIARNNSEQMSKSAGHNLSRNLGDRTNEFSGSHRTGAVSGHHLGSGHGHGHHAPAPRVDSETQELIKTICSQLRNPDFRERMEAIEKFQIMCETEMEIAAANLVQIFDKFNPCLTDSNSKVNYRALNTMFQITPLLGDNLSSVIANVVPLVAQNLASKNSEIQDMASNILDVFIEYLDGGVLIVPFTNIAHNGNARIRPQVIAKLADLIPHVYQRKQKQVDLHILPLLWSLLNTVKGGNSSSTTNGVSALNVAVTRLVQSVYEQMGEQLVDRAATSSAVSARNLELLKELITTPI